MSGFQVSLFSWSTFFFSSAYFPCLPWPPLSIHSFPFSAMLSVLEGSSLGTACSGPFLVGQRLGKYDSRRLRQEDLGCWYKDERLGMVKALVFPMNAHQRAPKVEQAF